MQILHRVTGGNPYFLAEMLRLLVAEGRLQKNSEGTWSWTGLGTLRLPESLVMAAKEKLARLPEAVRTMAEVAAVVGDEFTVETLSTMAETDPDDVERNLAEAVDAGVISTDAVSLGEDYRFYHTILRQVLYADLPPRRKRRLHEAAASALETNYPQDLERLAESISAHHEVAGNLKRALEWSVRAWRASRSRWQWNEALGNLDRIQRITEQLERMSFETDTDLKLQTQAGRGQALLAIGRLPEANRNVAENAGTGGAVSETYPLSRVVVLTAHEHWPDWASTRPPTSWLRVRLSSSNNSETRTGRTWHGSNGPPSLLQSATTTRSRSRPSKFSIRCRNTPAAPRTRQACSDGRWLCVAAQRMASDFWAARLSTTNVKANLRQRALFVRRLHWVHMMRGNYEECIRLAEYAHSLSLSVDDSWGLRAGHSRRWPSASGPGPV